MNTTDTTNLHWTERFVRDGFVILKGLAGREFCEAALPRVREIIKHDLPLNEWNTENTPVLYHPFIEGYTPPEAVLDRLFDQPRLLAAIDELLGGPGHWNQVRNYYLFLKPYNPDIEAKLTPHGHIDFPNQLIPILYRGFLFQVSLVDSEPFSGNITFYPGTHKLVQKALLDKPDLQFPNGMPDVPLPEPVEFVAEAGDVVFWHHLIMHEGNESHAANRTPRVALTGEVFRENFLTKVDPAQPDLSPWERRLALNGYYEETRPEIEHAYFAKRQEYFDGLKPNAEIKGANQ